MKKGQLIISDLFLYKMILCVRHCSAFYILLFSVALFCSWKNLRPNPSLVNNLVCTVNKYYTLNFVPQNSSVEISSLNTSKCNHVWKFLKGFHVEMRLLGWAPSSAVLIRKVNSTRMCAHSSKAICRHSFA
jgi:hypothetical protein